MRDEKWRVKGEVREERDVNGGRREKVKWNWSYNWRRGMDDRWGGINRFLVFNRHDSATLGRLCSAKMARPV